MALSVSGGFAGRETGRLRSSGDLIIQQMDDGKVLKRFVLPKGNGMLGGWSPDSREFGFGGWNADDPMPCIILDIETGLARQVVARSLTFSAWSPDGIKITLISVSRRERKFG